MRLNAGLLVDLITSQWRTIHQRSNAGQSLYMFSMDMCPAGVAQPRLRCLPGSLADASDSWGSDPTPYRLLTLSLSPSPITCVSVGRSSATRAGMSALMSSSTCSSESVARTAAPIVELDADAVGPVDHAGLLDDHGRPLDPATDATLEGIQHFT